MRLDRSMNKIKYNHIKQCNTSTTVPATIITLRTIQNKNLDGELFKHAPTNIKFWWHVKQTTHNRYRERSFIDL